MSGKYIYIGYYLSNTSIVKIGGTDNLDSRLYSYNHTTGHSRGDKFVYIFACEVSGKYEQVENDIRRNFAHLLETGSRETYLHNEHFFNDYIGFIRNHKSFEKEILIKEPDKKQVVKVVKKSTPSLTERGLTRKDIIKKAQNVKDDEFYTRYEDIEKEVLSYPKSIWKNKVVFCNCDDAVGETESEKDTSAFALFFLKNFQELGLKKLICTHYSGKVDLFNAGTGGYIYTKDGINIEKVFPKNYTGSFDDPLSLEILRNEADIVCTNPPFSRAIDYWDMLIKSKKKFLIISNITNAINTAFIPYFKDNKVWAGYNRVDYYLNPKRQLVDAAGHWYTNLKIKNRPKSELLKIMPLKKIPDEYKKYDDSKILLVDNGFIPNDYKKAFAVSARPVLNGLLEKGYQIILEKRYTPYINGKENFARVLVQKIEDS
jgi:hypothetical protein